MAVPTVKPMAKLIYSMLTSLDGYIEDEEGDFSWAMPDDEVHAFVNQLGASFGTHLYGRRMYDMMRYWETAGEDPELTPVSRDWATMWKAADKVVFSRTLAEPQSARTRIEREFDAQAIQKLKQDAKKDISISGPELAAHALRAGLVDEFQVFLFPVIVGSGKRFFPETLRLDLELVEERRFASGVIFLRYVPRS
jgi:dihydrofolate reductase